MQIELKAYYCNNDCKTASIALLKSINYIAFINCYTKRVFNSIIIISLLEMPIINNYKKDKTGICPYFV